MFIGWVWVNDSYQMNGIGTRLMQEAERAAQEMGFIRSILPLLRQPAAARSHVRVADFRFPASLFDRPNLNVDHTGIRLLHRLRDIEA